ncbi:MAG: iron complex outermembrane receptor protein [Spirosomataceae bacterium]|jgi:iron complex outermembrane receptor protein
MQLRISAFLILITISSFAQRADSTAVTSLDEVTVMAYESERPLLEISAPVNIISPKAIRRFDNTTFLPALNAFPGIRMEERSPGSYRLSIRGSSVRSPFGVRNVKVYWNNIPLSDANGITYFNLLDMSTIGSMEVIKGPAGSMYGATTGGVILLKSRTADASQTQGNGLRVGVLTGAFGTMNFNIAHTIATDKINSVLTYGRQKNDGYREHTNMERDVLNWRSSFFYDTNKTLNINVLYADLSYQTPGGLTADQVAENPQQSRPATRFTKSSIEQQAAISQRFFTTGISHEQRWDSGMSWNTSVFGNISHLENPFITNYEIRDENSIGGRTQFVYKKEFDNIRSKTVVGGELIRTYSTFDVYDNEGGTIGNRQSEEEVNALQSSVFLQEELTFNNGFILTLGGSLNEQRYRYFRRSDAPNTTPIEDLSGVPFSPRIALLKKFGNDFSVYGSLSQGFSPPTVQEFVTGYRSTNSFVPLAAEVGRNIEIGSRGKVWNNRLSYDVSVYTMELSNTIVRRIGADERERFVNSGNTRQNGLEVMLNAELLPKKLNVFSSYTFNDYTYLNYQRDETNFSGKKIPSVPQNVWVTGADLTLDNGFYTSAQLNFTDKIFLNDANTVSADSYLLLNARAGWKGTVQNATFNFFVDGDNLLNQLYSLGNDNNAFGSRYFNPAPPRNFRIGATFGI